MAHLHFIGGFNIDDFPIKLSITKVYSLPIFHLICMYVCICMYVYMYVCMYV